MALKRGDVVVMVAHDDLGRPRPGIVVQANEIDDSTSSVLVCPITSHITDQLPIRPTIDANAANGLLLQSQIMTDKLSAIRRDRIRRVIGTLDAETVDRLDRALLLVLGLAR